eukprot:Em0016g947a
MAAEKGNVAKSTSGPTSVITEQKLREIFDNLDKDKDGKLGSAELSEGFRQLGVPNAVHSTKDFLGKGDTNKDDLMDFAEFTRYCLANEQKLWSVFQQLDKNHDGEIDAEEVKLSLKMLGLDVSDGDVVKLLMKMDKDGNVRISWEEWREFLLLQPDTNIKSIFKYWSHGSVINIGEALDSIIIPNEFTAEEKTTGLWWRQLVAGGGAGAVSRTVTAPLDRLKIFFQVGGGQGRSLVSCFRDMLKEGGVKSLWRGNGVNVVKIVPESALRFFAFEQLKKMLHKDGQPTQVYERLAAGSAAGVISQTTVYPMEVLKTRLALGKTGQYSGMFDCARQIARTEGLRAFYRGLTPSLIGIIPYAGIDLTVYETLKNLWLKEHKSKDPGVLLPLMCGTVSSTCGQLVSYPLSLVRTRLQAKVGPPGQENLGIFKMLWSIYRNEGVPGLYRGIVPNFLKVIPAVGIGYVAYEQFKMMLHIRT